VFDKKHPTLHSTPLIFRPFSGSFTLANTAQSKKRAKQSEKRRRHNASQRSAMRTAIKKTLTAIQGGDQATAKAAYDAAAPALDRAVSQGIIHKNKAARHKSRLNTKVKALQA
jgi:small subunit ribosomal protein S20